MTDLLDSLIGAQPARDPLDDYIIQHRNRDVVAQARHVMRASDPAHIAEANRIARERDMPATLVESDLATFRDQEKIDRLRALSTRYPAIGRFASDGRAATIVADDSEALGRIAASMEAWRTRNPYSLRDTKPPEASLGSLVRGVYESFRTGAAGLRAQIEDAVPRPPFISKEAWEYSEGQSLKRVETAVGRQADAQPEFQSSTASGLYSGVSSIAQMAPGIAASIATRSPAPAVSSAALLTQTQAYAKYRARGASKGEAFTGATGEGVVEAIGELIPMGVVVKRFGASPVRKWVAEYLIKEGLTEQATTLAQDAIDTAIANPEKTWGDYLRERPDAAYQTALATLVGGAVIGGLSEGSRSFVRRRERAKETADELAIMDKVVEAAAKSKLRERDPVGFEAFVRETSQDVGADHVYVAAGALGDYLKQEN